MEAVDLAGKEKSGNVPEHRESGVRQPDENPPQADRLEPGKITTTLLETLKGHAIASEDEMLRRVGVRLHLFAEDFADFAKEITSLVVVPSGEPA